MEARGHAAIASPGMGIVVVWVCECMSGWVPCPEFPGPCAATTNPSDEDQFQAVNSVNL